MSGQEFLAKSLAVALGVFLTTSLFRVFRRKFVSFHRISDALVSAIITLLISLMVFNYF